MIFEYNEIDKNSISNHEIYIFRYRVEGYLDSRNYSQELHIIGDTWYLLDCKYSINSGICQLLLDKGDIKDLKLIDGRKLNKEERH